MQDQNCKDAFEEFSDIELTYKCAMFGLVHPDAKKVMDFLSAEQQYQKGLKMLINHLKSESKTAKELRDSVLERDYE